MGHHRVWLNKRRHHIGHVHQSEPVTGQACVSTKVNNRNQRQGPFLACSDRKAFRLHLFFSCHAIQNRQEVRIPSLLAACWKPFAALRSAAAITPPFCILVWLDAGMSSPDLRGDLHNGYGVGPVDIIYGVWFVSSFLGDMGNATAS